MGIDLAQPFRRYPILIWITEILWGLMLIGLPLTSLPLLGDITKSVVVPFSMIPLFAILLVWFVPFLLRRGGIPLESKPLIAFVLITIIASAITYFLGPLAFKNKTIQSQEFRAFITLVIGISFYFTIASWPTDQPRLKKALQLINLGGAIMIIWALIQAYYIVFHGINYPRLFALIRDHLVVQNSAVRDGNRVTGLAYEPSWFAHLLNVLYFPLWLSASYLRTSVFRWRLFRIISFENILILPALVVFILSSPRVGLLAFLLVLVFLLVKLNLAIYRIISKWVMNHLNAGRISMNLIKVLIRVGIVLVFIGVYLGGIFFFVKLFSKYDYRFKLLTQPFTQQELNGLGLNESSFIYIGNRFAFGERLIYWFAGWHTFNDYPWIGVGLGNSGYYFVSHLSFQGWDSFEIRDVIYRLYDLPNIKSLWIRLLSETGLIGFSFFATWYFLLWKSARATSRSQDMTLRLVALAGQLGLIAFLVEGFSIDSFALPYLWAITALIAAAGVIYRKEVRAA